MYGGIVILSIYKMSTYPFSEIPQTSGNMVRLGKPVRSLCSHLRLWANQLIHLFTEYNASNFAHQPRVTSRCRIVVPLRLQIVSYDHEGVVSPNFPIINFEGEMGGQEWDEDSEDQGNTPDVRHLTGSVSMLVDGSVRWSMVLVFTLPFL